MIVIGAALALEPATMSTEDAEHPLFESVRVLDLKANSETPTCEAARDALLEKASTQLAKSGHTVLLGVFAESIDEPPLTSLPCKQTGIPDAPSGAVTSATVLLARPGDGYPTVPTSRQRALVGLLGAVHEAEPESLSIVREGEDLYLDAGVRVHEAELSSGDRNSRAMKMLRAYVMPWIGRWTPLASQTPELSGAALSVDTRGRGEKGKRREVFRFVVETDGATAFSKGALQEPEWAAGLPVTVVTNPRKPDPQPVQLDAEAAAGVVTGGDRSVGEIDDIEDEE